MAGRKSSHGLILSNVLGVASVSVIVRRHHVGESFVVMEIAIAIFVEAFAHHNAVHHNVAFAYEISTRNIPKRLDGGLAVGIEIDCLGSWSGWTNPVKLHVRGGAMISGSGPVDVKKG